MKKQMFRLTSILFISLFTFSPSLMQATPNGWVAKLTRCHTSTMFGISQYSIMTECDEWGGACPNQFCCEPPPGE